ncbi:MAG: hypothetical protein KTR20_10010 [Cellvibrionaceae bacterium]|nr:hypothetical protein [Cellvibrionaceae bacterium]
MKDLSPRDQAKAILLSGGEIPADALETIDELCLEDTQIMDLSVLPKFKKLRRLFLNGCKVTDLSPLALCQSLEYLWLNETPVVDIAPLSAIPTLTCLGLENTEVTDISALANASELETLYLSGTAIKDISALSDLSYLSELDISATAITTISALKHIKSLTSLDLHETHVKDISALHELKKLNWLDISTTLVDDISVLRNLPGLDVIIADDMPHLANELEEIEQKNSEIFAAEDYQPLIDSITAPLSEKMASEIKERFIALYQEYDEDFESTLIEVLSSVDRKKDWVLMQVDWKGVDDVGWQAAAIAKTLNIGVYQPDDSEKNTIAKKFDHFNQWLNKQGYHYVAWHAGDDTHYGFVVQQKHLNAFYQQAAHLGIAVG